MTYSKKVSITTTNNNFCSNNTTNNNFCSNNKQKQNDFRCGENFPTYVVGRTTKNGQHRLLLPKIGLDLYSYTTILVPKIGLILLYSIHKY